MLRHKISFAEWLKRAAWIIFIIVIGYLLIASIFSTCYLGRHSYYTASKVQELNTTHTFYIRDSFWQHILVFLIFSVMLMIYGKKSAIKKAVSNQKYLPTVVCILAGAIAVVIVCASQYYPKYDQGHVMEIAAALNAGDYSDLEPGGYFHMYPFQMGIILYFQILSFLFGGCNYVAFQIVNALWIFLTYYLLVKIAETLWKDLICGLSVSVLCLLFLPYLLNVTFLYGSVVGMPFALLSFETMLLFERNPKIRYAVICGLSIGIAVVLKPNYQIYLIAEIIYVILSCFSNKKSENKKLYCKLLLLIFIIGGFMICKTGINQYLLYLNNGEKIKGIPMAAVLAMGLQDGKSAPGWYNGYHVGLYRENNYNYALTEEIAKEEIKRIITGYSQDIMASFSFFVKKISSQWNNPTFQSLWILEEREGKGGLEWILQGRGRYIYILWVNMLQTWILTGTLLYAVIRYKKSSLNEVLLPLAFVGGVLAHSFMEAQSLTALIYYPLLLPLCICGYREWQKWMLEKRREVSEKGWDSKEGMRLKKNAGIVVAIAILFCVLSYTEPFAKIFARNENTEVFNTYTQEIVTENELILTE